MNFAAVTQAGQASLHSTGWAIACLMFVPISEAYSQDTITHLGANGRNQRTSRGEIVDETDTHLAIKGIGGRVRQISTTETIRVTSSWTPALIAGDGLFSKGDYSTAITEYGRALREEIRPWVRRRIIGRVIQCEQYRGQHLIAAQMFLKLWASRGDAFQNYVIPVVWKTTHFRPAELQEAENLLTATEPAKLIGASWLLSTKSHTKARAALQKLENSESRWIRSLASAQLWRTNIASANLSEVSRWRNAITQMPREFRPGPWFVVGQTYAQLSQHADTALAFLRVSVLFADHHDLVDESLYGAGRAVERLGQQDEAASLYRELIESFPGSQLTGPARDRLEAFR